MAVLIKARREALRPPVASALLAAALCGCALPGPPLPPTPPARSCPAAVVVEGSSAGLRIDLAVTPELLVPGASLEVLRSADQGEPTLIARVGIDDALQRRALTGPLAFLDAAPPWGSSVRYALLAPGATHCAGLGQAVALPRQPATPEAPFLAVHGLAVRVSDPADSARLARLYRRDLRAQTPATTLAERWDTREPFVDLDVEAGRIYAYSMAVGAPLEVGSAVLWSDAGPESYAPVPALDQLVAP